MKIGFTMMCEQSGPRELVRDVAMTEEAGFDYSVISDHYVPWLDEQGLVRTGRCRPGHLDHSAHDLRDLSDPPLPPAVVAHKAAWGWPR
jgi:hypothetical protein